MVREGDQVRRHAWTRSAARHSRGQGVHSGQTPAPCPHLGKRPARPNQPNFRQQVSFQRARWWLILDVDLFLLENNNWKPGSPLATWCPPGCCHRWNRVSSTWALPLLLSQLHPENGPPGFSEDA